LDRRTNGPKGQGGASPTVVTSRVNGEDLEDLDVDDDQGTRPSDIRAASRPTARKPAAAGSGASGSGAGAGAVKTAPPNGHTANGALVTGNAPADEAQAADAAEAEDAAGHEATPDYGYGAADATVADVVPALPGDNIGSPASDDWMAGGPAESTAAPFATDPSPPWSSIPSSSSSPLSGFSSSGSSPSSSSASTLPSRPAPASTEPPAMAPAAFVWDMPDPPPTSPSSPARTFLRADATAKSPAPKTPVATVTAKKPPPGPAPDAPQGTQKKGSSKRSARTAHLTIARIEPWSVMKFSFIVSLVAFVILFVAVSVLYAVLSWIGVFDSLQHVVSSLTSSQDSTGVNASHWFSASRVLSYTAILGGFNIVLITAMSTIGAVVYNLTSRLVGGVEVTLRETE
jgi:hypothetical protein